MNDTSTIHLFRRHAFAGSGVTLKVILDNEEVGLIKDRTSISLSVPSGMHRLYLKERRKQVSPALFLHLQPQDEIELICRYEFGRALRSRERRPHVVELWQEPWRTSQQRKSSTRTDPRLLKPIVHEDLEPYYETLDKEMREIDNSKSSASVIRSIKATREWYRGFSIELQETQAARGDLQVGPTWLRLKASAENMLRETYSVEEGTRQVFEEQISVTIPGKTTTRIILQWKRRWIHGYVQLLDPADRVVKVPFKIVAGVTFDQMQIDEPPVT